MTERLIGQRFEMSNWGNPFPVLTYTNPENYTYKCHYCQSPAIYRLEIYSHLYEPQGSEYYCVTCIPQQITNATV